MMIFPARSDKKPYTLHGYKDASTDPDRIRGWFERWPDARIAYPTGEITGIVVIDTDSEQAEAELQARGFSPGPLVRTRRGWHRLYRHPGQYVKSRQLFDGCDIKADGGYVLAPPSPGYSWQAELNGYLPDLPGWVTAEPKKPDVPETIIEGGRDNALTREAGKLRRLGYGQAEIEALLQQLNTDRCRPPLPAEDVSKIARSVARYEPARRIGTGGGLVFLSKIDEPEPRKWLVDKVLPLGDAGGIYGDGGVAKSYLAMDLGMAVAGAADDWLGFAVEHAPVIYLDFELDIREQGRRAYKLARGRDLQRPPDNLAYISALDMAVGEAFELTLDQAVQIGAKLVIVDSIGLAMDGDAEASKDVIGFYRRNIQPFKAAGISPFVIDHQAKTIKGEKYSQKRMFGSVYKENPLRSIVQIERTDGDDGWLTANLRHSKSSFAARFDAFEVKTVFASNSVRIDRTGATVEAALSPDDLIRNALENVGPKSRKELATILESRVGEDAIKKHVREMIRREILHETAEKDASGGKRIAISGGEDA